MHCVIYVQHSRYAGMDAHISQPFDVKTLCICLAALTVAAGAAFAVRRPKDKQ